MIKHSQLRRVALTVGEFLFIGSLEGTAAPVSTAWLAERLPLEGLVRHARWSGEAGWLPLGIELTLAPENAITHPNPGQLLLYAGDISEPELLIPYGSCAFACKAGRLAGNHVVTLESNISSLRSLGETLLMNGALAMRLAWR